MLTFRVEVFNFHFHALRKQYLFLVNIKSPQVIKTSNGFERQVSFDSYVFDVLKQGHKMPSATLDNLCCVMAGDVKATSLNVGLRHRTGKAPVAKPSASPVPNMLAAALRDCGVHVPCAPTASLSIPESPNTGGAASSSGSSSTVPHGDLAPLSTLLPK